MKQNKTIRIWLALIALCVLLPLLLWEKDIDALEGHGDLKPVFSVSGGYYHESLHLGIKVPDSDAIILFTTNGSLPTPEAGRRYESPLLLSAVPPAIYVIRAQAYQDGKPVGPTVSASYMMGLPASLPVMSLTTEPADLWDRERGIYANPYQRGEDWERPVHITYVDENRDKGFSASAGIRIHGNRSRDFEKKAFRLYFRQAYGTGRLDYPLFPESAAHSFNRLVLRNGGQDYAFLPKWNWTLMRSELVADIARDVGAYATHSRPILLFINGEAWGVYQLHERPDEDWLSDHYGITSSDFLKAPEHVHARDIIQGDRQHWDHLMTFVENHDLALDANYQYIQTQVDIDNFIDYYLLQICSGNVDWPHQNVYQFRPKTPWGRWQWVIWDNDYSFGLNPNRAQAEVNILQTLLEPENPKTQGKDLLLFHALLKNSDFLNQFLSRADEFLNGPFKPEKIRSRVDTISSEFEMDIHYEIMRWSTPDNWRANIIKLKQYVSARPTYVRRHMIESFALDGSAKLVVDAPSVGHGTLALNGLVLGELPYKGRHFKGVPLEITAVPAAGYRFAEWVSPELGNSPTIILSMQKDLTLTPQFVPLPPDAVHVNDVRFMACHVESTNRWFELQVTRQDGVDLRGWCITDNDTLTSTDEGSLCFPHHPALTHVPSGTQIRVDFSTDEVQVPDDLTTWDHKMTFYVKNDFLDTQTDPGFWMGEHDNLMLLASDTPSESMYDHVVDFVIIGGLAPSRLSSEILQSGITTSRQCPCKEAIYPPLKRR
jgi:hypothetical protein